jgi:urate oxidase
MARLGRSFPINRNMRRPIRFLSQAFTKALNDIATVTDTAIDTILGKGAAFLETVTLSEVFTKAVTRLLSETATLSEVFSTVRSKIFIEVVTLSESVLKLLNGAALSAWTKVAKLTATYTKVAKATVSNIWTRVAKP